MNINNVLKVVKDDGIIFLSYGGFLSQTLISGMTEALEKESSKSAINMGVSNNIFTIFIELSQNMMNYSKNTIENNRNIDPSGLIIVSKDDENSYYIHSQNIVSIEDKEKMTPKLIDVTTLSKDEIKKKYKELRRSGKDTHWKGGGLGFYEIAKRCDSIEYNFREINKDKFYFHIKTKINLTKSKEK